MGCTKGLWFCSKSRNSTASTNAKMGKKGNWFSAMKKALHSEEKEKEKEQDTQESVKQKKKWFRKKKKSSSNATPAEADPTTTAAAATTTAPTQPTVTPVVAASEPAKRSSSVDTKATDNKEQMKHAYTVAVATAKAAEVAVGVAAAHASTEVARLTANSPPPDAKSKEEVAAIKIQTAFRGYMAKRTLRALRGIMRLKTVMQGQAIKRQTANTLKSMQTLARVQSQMHERRQRMAEENLARQKQIQQNYAKEQAKDQLEKSKHTNNGDGWDGSRKTKEQIEAKLQSRHEAAIRRERTLAYAFTHQQAWKASSMSGHTLFMDVNNPHWGWSWLERWLAARPWEIATTPEKDISNENSPRVKISMSTFSGVHHDLPKPFARKQPRSSTAGRLSTSSVSSRPTSATRKLRAPSPKVSPKVGPRSSMWGHVVDDADARSMQSEQESSRRNSVTGSTSSIKDDNESIESSQTLPSYMAPTEATKARSRLGGSECKREKSVTPDRVSVSSATKKRASQPASPARSRRSASSTADANST